MRDYQHYNIILSMSSYINIVIIIILLVYTLIIYSSVYECIIIYTSLFGGNGVGDVASEVGTWCLTI